MADSGVDLTSVIQQLRYDIEKTWWEGQQSGVALEVGTIELEVSVEVEKSKDAKFGVKFYVVDAGAGAAKATTVTQRLTIPLTPRDKRNAAAPLLISGNAEASDDLPSVPDRG